MPGKLRADRPAAGPVDAVPAPPWSHRERRRSMRGRASRRGGWCYPPPPRRASSPRTLAAPRSSGTTRRRCGCWQAYDQGISEMLFRTCCMASNCRPLGVVSVRPTGHHSSGASRSAANPAESVSRPAGSTSPRARRWRGWARNRRESCAITCATATAASATLCCSRFWMPNGRPCGGICRHGWRPTHEPDSRRHHRCTGLRGR